MPKLDDETTRKLILDALSATESGKHVRWKPLAFENLRKLLPRLTPARVTQIMRLHTKAGKRIDEVPERREEHQDEFCFHYDFRISIGGTSRYIETVLILDRPNDPELIVVNFKNA